MKSWNPGDKRVEKYMIEVANSIKKYIKHPSDDFTDIYNRCYEAVWKALTDSENIPKDINTVGYWLEYFHSQIFTEISPAVKFVITGKRKSIRCRFYY